MMYWLATFTCFEVFSDRREAFIPSPFVMKAVEEVWPGPSSTYKFSSAHSRVS
jgi:hypothetical protein